MRKMGSLFKMGKKGSMFPKNRQRNSMMWISLVGLGAAALYGFGRRQNLFANIIKPLQQKFANSQIQQIMPNR
ncbi:MULTISPECIES: hypothetical protein [Aeribacillus]|jgi:hypothetical protein|uniref:Uncharacterized protein n=1 Tax=Aeribacillus pallidus TaxID=33936 RepID=A0A161ZPG3_9BACI|nr:MULTISPECIES: hypothetical protein [Aeribacillus]REJ25023.1 MAG: hypothetical protein C6W54_05530 [Bacillaceae bacterium]KZN94697.1 hypothetical protein AZI98_18525 [Aeribacillus pallidus]MDR9794921.1 hypothetical protein [Aeribacillus pallidus]MED1443173.1 hypothetical protein [Aeribacillus composti]TVZ86884.1 hypothetical protein FB379_104108 [Aeribacillus composti]